MIQQLNTPKAKKRAEKIAKMIHMDLLREGREVYLNTSGSSMYPFLKGLDRLKIAPLRGEKIKIGDIIAIDNRDKNDAWFYVHRVIDIFKINNRKMYITKGDANREGIDEPVEFERIVGKLVAIERDGLKINYETPLWENYLNKRIARISFRHGRRLRFFAPYISLILEWRRVFSKLARRISGGLDAPLGNAEEFLLICAGNNLGREIIKWSKELLRRGIDWEFFMLNAARSGLAFVFYNSLRKIDCPSLIPEEFIKRLKVAYFYALRKSTVQHAETMRLLRLFSEEDIVCVPLKGTILSERLYGDIAARGMSVDIDLLIGEKDRAAARKILEKAGYSFVEAGEIWNRLGQHIFRKTDGTVIDLHWEISPVLSSEDRMMGFLSGVRIKEEGDTCYYEFKEEELLLQLAAHLVDSSFLIELRYVTDVNELLAKYGREMDWESVVEKAKKWRLSTSLYTALVLSRTFFKSYVPEEALASLRPGVPKRILVRMLTNKKVIMHRNSKKRRFIEKFLKYILFQTLEARSLKDYLAIVFPEKHKMGGKSHPERLLGGARRLMGITKRRSENKIPPDRQKRSKTAR
ncbi:MAG: nucleotidyltransferase family protein [Candidatus Omnitrophota bacterium]